MGWTLSGPAPAQAQATVPAPTAVASPATTLRFAPESAYAPFVFDGPDGQPAGLSIDLLRAVEPRLNARLRWLPSQPLDAILDATRRGQVDVVSSLRPTPDRAGYLVFTAPYVKVPAVLVSPSTRPAADLHALSGRRVGVGQGYAVEAAMRERYPAVKWVPVRDDDQGLAGLRAGELDGLVADLGSVRHLMKIGAVRDVQVGAPVGFDYPLSFAVRREHSAFAQELDKALRELEPRRRREIVQRWLSDDTAAYASPELARWRQAALGALVVLVLLFAGVTVRSWLQRRGRAGAMAPSSPAQASNGAGTGTEAPR